MTTVTNTTANTLVSTPTAPERETVRRAKRLLVRAGYNPGKLDGRPTEAFRSALRAFQRAWRLPQTGTLDRATMGRLRETAQALSNRSKQFVTTGVKRASVKAIEARLTRLGYDVGKVDDVYSRSTFEAVKQFKADHPRLGNEGGGMGVPAQELLAQLSRPKGDSGRDANVRAISFNWPSRYRKGGDAADEAMFNRLSAKADVMGFQEFGWAHKKITDKEKNWSFFNPNPPKDGDDERAGQVLAWRKDKFNLVETGTTLMNRPTRVQKRAAGPTLHRGKSIIWAKLRHRETGEIWTVAVVHFVPSKHLGGAAEELWRKQRDTVARWMRQQGPRTLVMGDFNGEWNDKIARPLHDVARAQRAPSHGRREIDWVLRSRDLKAVGGGEALSNRGQSDHRPVRGVVRG